MSGQHPLDSGDLRDAIERVEERSERIARAADARDMRRDTWQHVVASDEDPRLGIVKAEMVHGVAGRVNGLHADVADAEGVPVLQELVVVIAVLDPLVLPVRIPLIGEIELRPEALGELASPG